MRDDSGEVIAAAKGGGPAISVNAHELQGIELGLNLAIVRDIKKAHLAIDSMFIYFLLTKKEFTPPWNLIQIWRRVERLKTSFEVLKISQIYRETNRAPDHLASFHLSSRWVDVAIKKFSIKLCKIIREDKDGKLYPRS